MGPLLTIYAKVASQFSQNAECPISSELMTEAVTLMPCGHTFNESSVHRIRGIQVQDAPAPCDEKTERITKVRVVTKVACPLCQGSVTEYYRNWACRSMCQEIPNLLKPAENKADPSLPTPKAVPAPRKPLQERFATLVGGFFACCLSLSAVGYAMHKRIENAALIKQIEQQNESMYTLKGVLMFGVIAVIFCAYVSKK
jgi:hypothetical protein